MRIFMLWSSVIIIGHTLYNIDYYFSVIIHFFRKNIMRIFSIAGFTSLLACFKTPVCFNHFICKRNCEGKTRDTVTLYNPEQRGRINICIWAWRRLGLEFRDAKTKKKYWCYSVKFTKQDGSTFVVINCCCTWGNPNVSSTRSKSECWLEYTSFFNLQNYSRCFANRHKPFWPA